MRFDFSAAAAQSLENGLPPAKETPGGSVNQESRVQALKRLPLIRRLHSRLTLSLLLPLNVGWLVGGGRYWLLSQLRLPASAPLQCLQPE